MQLEGIDFFETYAPVVTWTTTFLMLILEILLQFKSKQGDITAAFIHAKLEENEKVSVNMPKGLEQYDKRGKQRLLSFNNNLYVIHQILICFGKYLTKK